jgi:EAL domain-containing protein (putative c-di-GMP-specific phosphodiesterase class I)
MPSGTRIAIFHDDSKVAASIAAFAAEANLETVHPVSATALEVELHDPLMAAVVLDLVGPKGGGFELIERLSNAPSHPQMIVVTALDVKTVDSIRRLGNTKGLKLRVFKKDGDAEELRSFVAKLEKRDVRFGVEHLDDAIARGYLHVEYQPKVPLKPDVEEFSVEALCRLKHPQFGNVFPDQFIAMAEKHGLIAKLTDSVACHAFRDLNMWRDDGLLVRLALNVSPELLKTPHWCDQFMRRCAEFDIEPERITLEITESQSGATLDVALDVLTRLRLKGFTLSIDDFGTGFSSLATLYKLPFSELKIDKSFTFDLQKSAEARALIETTIGMAQRLGLKVVAEGVETEAVFRELRLMGCQHAQCYFISKSIAADKVPQFFADWDSLMKSEPIHEENALPKIAIIQSLLSDILNDDSSETDATLVLSDFANPRPAAEEDSTLELTRKIPTLVLQGKVAVALARCQAAIRRLERTPERAPLTAKILQLRHLLEQELIFKDDLELSVPNGRVRLLPRQAALIGRPSSAKAVDVPVGCRWFSRGEKNLRLFTEGTDWFVEDLGSTNGSWIDDAVLLPGDCYALPFGETLIEIGKHAGEAAPIAISLWRPPANPGAVVVSLKADAARLAGKAAESKWPNWRQDLRTRWVLFNERLTLGTSAGSAIVLDEAGVEKAAEIWFDEGFWIAPAGNAQVTIADTPFLETAPLPIGADLTIGDARLRTESLKPDVAPAAVDAPPLRAKSG